jgi:chromate transporter
VQQTGWLNGSEFLVAVAVVMPSPGPVLITATFVGFLVAGFCGSLVSTIGIFLPSFILILAVAPILLRHRANPNVQGFAKGAYAPAIGTIVGACVPPGTIAIGDWLTALIAADSLAVLFRWRVSNPLLVATTAVIGWIAFPILQPTMGTGERAKVASKARIGEKTDADRSRDPGAAWPNRAPRARLRS